MKKVLLILILLVVLPFNCYALSDSSKSSMVIDIESGRILYQKNANSKQLIASTTKIMTFIVAMDNAKLNDLYTADKEILESYGTSIYLEYKEKMKLKDLLYGLILRSGNDASLVIANNVSKDEEAFVSLMNKKANDIGMTNTIYCNPHGLDEKTKNISTASDMAKLSRYAYNNYPFYRKVINTKKYSFQNYSKNKTYLWYNRNELLKKYKYAIGAKTGYTPKARKTFVSIADKNGFKISIVSLKDSDIYKNHINIYEYLYKRYKRYKIVDKNKLFTDKKYYIKEDFYYPLTLDERNNLEILIKIDKKEKVVEVMLDKKIIKKIKIYKQTKKKKNFFSSLFS